MYALYVIFGICPQSQRRYVSAYRNCDYFLDSRSKLIFTRRRVYQTRISIDTRGSVYTVINLNARSAERRLSLIRIALALHADRNRFTNNRVESSHVHHMYVYMSGMCNHTRAARANLCYRAWIEILRIRLKPISDEWNLYNRRSKGHFLSKLTIFIQSLYIYYMIQYYVYTGYQ